MDSSSNPVFSDKAMRRLASGVGTDEMTVSGSISKTAVSMVLLLFAAIAGWMAFPQFGSAIPWGFIIALMIITPIIGIVTAFRPSGILVATYAVFEGFLIGFLSRTFEASYNGIVVQAVLLTFATMLGMLFLYVNGTVKMTQKARSVIMIATLGVVIYFLFEFIMALVNPAFVSVLMSGPVGIVIAVVIVGIAALNLLLDFDFISRGVEHKLPKKTEWYAAFGLMVTLVWLYVSILRLLAASRR